jgi:hypothetical protein
MQLKTLILTLFIVAIAQVESNTPPCWTVPPEQQTPYCILTFWTNSGMIIDITKPSASITAQATVYSPDCKVWGETTIIPDHGVEIMAIGLSAKLPLRFNTEFLPGNTWASPKFEYGGMSYGLNTGCTCWGTEGDKQCHCPFL